MQGSTALILLLAANTSYADFPRLLSILARDRFAPRWFALREDRLAFSTGITALALLASLLLVAFASSVDRLLTLYAIGVLTSFTLSQAGMVVHWIRSVEANWWEHLLHNQTALRLKGALLYRSGVAVASFPYQLEE